MKPEQSGVSVPHAEIPQYIKDLQRRFPTGIENPREAILRATMEQSGLLPQMLKRNPGLERMIPNFLVGEQNILVVGGESGMGKSLIAADLRKMHSDLGYLLPPGEVHPLIVTSYDRVHKSFYDVASTYAGTSLPLPQGETPIEGREVVSDVLEYQVRLARRQYGRDVRILVEAPLIDTRGETILEGLDSFKNQIQTIIMHSPESRNETLVEGRMMETSGQPDSMMGIRGKLLKRIFGDAPIPKRVDAQDAAIRAWWGKFVENYNGLVVDWAPSHDRRGFNNSKQVFVEQGLKPDVISPVSLSIATSREMDTQFMMRMADDTLDEFLLKIAA